MATKVLRELDEVPDDFHSTASTAVPSEPSYSTATEAEDTVLIFDWDDTLCCSTFLQRRRWSGICCSAMLLSSRCKKELQQLESAACSILETALGLGEVLIVTNANEVWVWQSAKLFLPRLLPLLAEVCVVSARDLFRKMPASGKRTWKRRAFEYHLTQVRHFPNGVNLVVLGDQDAEIEAGRHAAQVVGSASVAKTLKFKENPTAGELIGQLTKVEMSLGRIAAGTQERAWDLKCLRRGKSAGAASNWEIFAHQESSTSTYNTPCLVLGDLWRLLAKRGKGTKSSFA